MIDIKTYAKPKSSSEGGGSKTIVINRGRGSGSVEGHTLWGQYYDGTQDVDGDLNRVGNIYSTGTINANTVSSLKVNTTNLQAENADIGKLKADEIDADKIGTDDLTALRALIQYLWADAGDFANLKALWARIEELEAGKITTDYLTVTKAAHFFKLIIDEIKATQGAVIVTPANAKVDKVEEKSNVYRLYFRSKDNEGHQINNNFVVNDQILCQTFNVARGTNYNVSNKYYWAKCTAVSSTVSSDYTYADVTEDGFVENTSAEAVDFHWIEISKTDCDKQDNSTGWEYGVPAAGDEIVMLGNRNQTDRQAAIIISAYNNTYLDQEIKSPSIVQYDGINDYQLKNHRVNVISKGLNLFKGKFTATTGKDIEDIITETTKQNNTYLHVAWCLQDAFNGGSLYSEAEEGVNWWKQHPGNYGQQAEETYIKCDYIGTKWDNTESDTALTFKDYTWIWVGSNDGDYVSNINEWYLVSPNSSGVTRETTGWSRNIPTMDATNRYLWNYESIFYIRHTGTSRTTTSRVISTDPVIIGVYGENGTDGRGIVSITNYYLATSSNSGITRSSNGWTKTVQTTTNTNKYLWNYEEIAYTTGNPTYTDPRIIGTYGDKGDKGDSGDNGRGISAVKEWYLASASATGITRTNTSGWTETVQTTSASKKYLWNYEQIQYTYGSDTYTDACVIGVFGVDGTNGSDGRGISSITEYYLASAANTGVTRSTSGWTTTVQTVTNTNKYLWNYEKITYTTGSPTYTTPAIIGVYGDKGDSGTDGNSITGVTEYYLATSLSSGVTRNTSGWTETIQNMTNTNKYLWNYEKITYSSKDTEYSTPVIIGVYGDKGQDGTNGKDGRGISSITNYYLATSASTGVTRTGTTGWTTTVQTVTATNKYLWNYEDILYTDNTHSYTDARIIGTYGDKGEPGQNGTGSDGEMWKLIPVTEKAIVSKSGVLGVAFEYNIMHIKGSTTELLTASTSNYYARLRPNTSSTWTNLSVNTQSPSYTNTSYQTNYKNQTNKVISFTIQCVKGSTVLDQRVVAVVFDVAASLEINDLTNSINATVQGHTTQINNLTGDYTEVSNYCSELNIKMDGITTTVSEHTNKLNGIGANNMLRETKELNTDCCGITGTINGTYTIHGVTFNTVYKGYSGSGFDDVLFWDNFSALESNTYYTLSFWAKGSGTFISHLYPNAVSSGKNSAGNTTTSSDGNISFTLTSSWKRYWVTWLTPSSISGSKSIIIARLNSSGNINICAPKLERGYTYTDWSPHPQDVYADFIEVSNNVSEISQTASQIQSTVTTIQNNYVTSSQLTQTSTNIKAEIKNGLNSTGINIETGKITLDADNTTITGNLNITDPSHGLTIYETINDKLFSRIDLQTRSVGILDNYQTQDRFYMLNMTGSSSSSESGKHMNYNYSRFNTEGTASSSTGGLQIAKNSVVTVYSPYCMIYGTSGSTTVSLGYPRFILYATGEDSGITYTVYDSGAYGLDYTMQYHYKAAGFQTIWTSPQLDYYSFRIKILSSNSYSSSYSMNCTASVQLLTSRNSQLFIGKDGLCSNITGFNRVLFNSDEFLFQKGIGGLRIKSFDNGNNPLLGHIEVGTNTMGGDLPHIRPVWVPLYNYTPIVEIGASDFTSKTVYFNNGSYTRYVYDVPTTLYGMIVITSTPNNGNVVVIRLPYTSSSTAYKDSDGNTSSYPKGYTVTVRRNCSGNVYVMPYRGSSSNTYTNTIQDANGDYNEYFEMNGPNNYTTSFVLGSSYAPYSTIWYANTDT